jgi:formylglycine-generating enzyme required for sulfatase activity
LAELLPSFTNSIGMEFILIPAGEFTMGSPDWDLNASDNEKPAHQVTISQDFYLGKYPVTQAQWQAVHEGRVHVDGHRGLSAGQTWTQEP